MTSKWTAKKNNKGGSVFRDLERNGFKMGSFLLRVRILFQSCGIYFNGMLNCRLGERHAEMGVFPELVVVHLD